METGKFIVLLYTEYDGKEIYKWINDTIFYSASEAHGFLKEKGFKECSEVFKYIFKEDKYKKTYAEIIPMNDKLKMGMELNSSIEYSNEYELKDTENLFY